MIYMDISIELLAWIWIYYNMDNELYDSDPIIILIMNMDIIE